MTYAEKERLLSEAINAYYARDVEVLRRTLMKLLAAVPEQPRKDSR